MLAFDPKREAIVLCAGDRSKNPKRFYRKTVAIADDEFAGHFTGLNEIKMGRDLEQILKDEDPQVVRVAKDSAS